MDDELGGTREPGEKKGSAGLIGWLSARLNLTEIFSLLTSYGLFHGELDTRKPLPEALDEVRGQPMPSYARWPRVLGLVVVVLLGLELLTGSLLALYYLPTPEAAHASLGTLLRDVHFGWLIHQIHFWGAQALIVVLLLRVLRFLFDRVYEAPRELVWIVAALLLLVGFHLDLTGRALPWTTQAYWSSVRSLEIAASVPIYGSVVLFLLGGGGTAITDLTLIRFYVMHVAVLPLLAVLLVYLHFSGVRRVGTMAVPGDKPVPADKAVPVHLVNLAILLTLIFGLVVTLAVLVPAPFETEADPFSTPVGARPPWYLLAPFGYLEWSTTFLPAWLSGSVLFLAFGAFVALPFLDRRVAQGRRRTFRTVLVVAFLIAWIAFTLHGARVA